MTKSESRLLDLILPRFEEAGYTVIRAPGPSLLPAFLRERKPDAVALGEPRNLAIDVVGVGETSGAEARPSDHPDWEWRVYLAPSSSRDPELAAATPDAVEANLDKVAMLLALDQSSAALLLGWSTLEAAGRALLPRELARPQSATQLIETLAMEGIVTLDEAERLRRLAVVRNQVAHGDLRAAVDPAAVADLVATLRLAIAEANAAEPTT